MPDGNPPGIENGITTIEPVRDVVPLSESSTGKIISRAKTLKARLAASRLDQEALKKQSLTDELTGLPNRRWFFDELTRRVAEAKRTGKSVWMVIADIDHFKSVNDTYGHQKGDAVLKSWGEVSARSEEPFARYGGEEFAQVMQDGHTVEEVQKILSRFSSDFGTSSESILNGDRRTVSYGIARLDPSDTPDTLMRKADQALYHSKYSGRDRLSIYSETPEGPAFQTLPILTPNQLLQAQTANT